MRKKNLLFIFLLLSVGFYAQQKSGAFPAVYNTLASKNYYLLHEIDQRQELRKRLQEDEVLNEILKNKSQEISSSLLNSAKPSTANVYVEPYIFSSEEIQDISTRLKELYRRSEEIRSFVQNELKPSGAYILYDGGEEEEELFSMAWEVCARGINHVLNTYGKGKHSRYAAIDSVSYDVKSNYYRQTLSMWSNNLHSEIHNPRSFILNL